MVCVCVCATSHEVNNWLYSDNLHTINICVSVLGLNTSAHQKASPLCKYITEVNLLLTANSFFLPFLGFLGESCFIPEV